MANIAGMTIADLLNPSGLLCSCGKFHSTSLQEAIIGPDALNQLPRLVNSLNIKHPFIISDLNTYEAAGKAACRLLSEESITYTNYIMESQSPLPTEYWVGSAILRCPQYADGIIGVGSGTINDICKIIADKTKLPYLIVGTAPSMDGYASNTSSMILSGLKVTINAVCPNVIIADTSIMAQAPMPMLQAGLGDMIAKYISICEWRISHLINDEYYCEEIADLVRNSLKQCMESASLLPQRSLEAVGNVVSGLILSGIAMSYAGISRPASGTEHYFSHIWDMTSLDHGYEHDLHGIQCGVATLLTIKIYDYIRQLKPDRRKALQYVHDFSREDWEGAVCRLFGTAASSIIDNENKEHKFNQINHAVRLQKLLTNWSRILLIIDEELPPYDWLLLQMQTINAPVLPDDLNIHSPRLGDVFIGTKDIRNKYISSHLLWDLGLLEEAAKKLF